MISTLIFISIILLLNLFNLLLYSIYYCIQSTIVFCKSEYVKLRVYTQIIIYKYHYIVNNESNINTIKSIAYINNTYVNI